MYNVPNKGVKRYLLEKIIEMPSFCTVFMWNNNYKRDGDKSLTESETILTHWGDSTAPPSITYHTVRGTDSLPLVLLTFNYIRILLIKVVSLQKQFYKKKLLTSTVVTFTLLAL